jgi:hypothetical protein
MGGLWRRATAGKSTRGLLAGLPLLLAAGCATGLPSAGGTVPAEGYVAPPRIAPPAPGRRTLLKIDPGALPEGARAHFPAFDGDPIIVTLPAKLQSNVTRDQILKDVVGPVLKALGFSGGLAALAMPPDGGVKQPRADFKRLARIVADKYARNPELQREKAPRMLGAFLGTRPAYPEIDRALLTAEGMAFAQYVAEIERLEVQYPFQQVHQGVPIERGMLVASRWEGQTVTSVFGSLFVSYAVANKPVLTPAASVTAARRALLKLQGIEAVPPRDPVEGPTLMLLPYGTDSNGVARLRYAYRLLVGAVFSGQEAQFLVWIDADNAVILKVEPFASRVMASGVTYNRDPGVGTVVSGFEVDTSSAGAYTLRRTLPSPVSTRLDYQGDGFNGADVSISDSMHGSSASFANFDQPSINDPTKAMCAGGSNGSNKAFQQVSLFATLMRQRDTIVGQGIFEPFPQTPWSPMVETTSSSSWFNMNFGAGDGYRNSACPDFSDGTMGQKNFINFAQDNTMIGHEIGHNATWRLTTLRPPDWCGQANCSLPVGWAVLHDLADFWGAQLEATNCIGGWVAKNMGGVNASLNCLQSSKTNWLPRKLEVQTPMVPGDADDHFPEHKGLPVEEYSNGQVGGAAIWQVLEGMRSKCGLCGPLQFGVRFLSALKQTGFFGFEPGFTDTGIYQLLYDLEAKMADQWAASGSSVGPPPFDLSGPHTTNKVTAGFARAGIFLIPYQCLGADTEPGDETSCPAGGNGGDAVIDIDDNDTSNDPVLNGVTHPEVDFLKLNGVAPTFHVWTGPRYRLNGADGAATFTNPAPCNGRFRVEVSTDPAFPAASTITGAWKTVSRNPSSATAQCYGKWTPTAPEWTKLQAGGAGTLIYYRARTQKRTGGNERLSTLPGNGLWSVPPPYAVITATGRPDY